MFHTRRGFEVCHFSDPQLYKDVELLKSCSISGFNHFKDDRGFDRGSSEIIVVFRWMATYRLRDQGVLHLPELLKLQQFSGN
jgi:hypothetical protein